MMTPSYHEDAKVRQVVAETDGFVAGGPFGRSAAFSVPASSII